MTPCQADSNDGVYRLLAGPEHWIDLSRGNSIASSEPRTPAIPLSSLTTQPATAEARPTTGTLQHHGQLDILQLGENQILIDQNRYPLNF